MTRTTKVAKRRGGSRPRRGPVAGEQQINVRVTAAEKAAIKARAARTHGGDVSAHLRAGSDLAGRAREAVEAVLDVADDRALTETEDHVLLLLAPDLRDIASLSGPLTSDPAIRKAG